MQTWKKLISCSGNFTWGCIVELSLIINFLGKLLRQFCTRIVHLKREIKILCVWSFVVVLAAVVYACVLSTRWRTPQTIRDSVCLSPPESLTRPRSGWSVRRLTRSLSKIKVWTRTLPFQKWGKGQGNINVQLDMSYMSWWV